MAIRVLIVDDHPIVRQGLHSYLGLDPQFEVLGEATDGAEAVQMARDLLPDVILMDLLMPVMDGVTAIAAIRKEMPDIEILALTSAIDERLAVRAIQAGAIGYLLKDTEVREVRRAVAAAAAGQVQLSPRIAASVMQQLRVPSAESTLTERELEVLRLLARGHSNKELSQELGVSDTTVKSHVASILGKLGLPSRTQAALYAIRVGLVDVHSSQLQG